MEAETRVLREPCFDLWMLVRPIIVGDAMKVEMHRGGAVDGLQELEKLLMPVPRSCGEAGVGFSPGAILDDEASSLAGTSQFRLKISMGGKGA
jgi:hypothetical protein